MLLFSVKILVNESGKHGSRGESERQGRGSKRESGGIRKRDAIWFLFLLGFERGRKENARRATQFAQWRRRNLVKKTSDGDELDRKRRGVEKKGTNVEISVVVGFVARSVCRSDKYTVRAKSSDAVWTGEQPNTCTSENIV
jgi:hypothetical protein